MVAEGYKERLRTQWHQFALVAKALGAEVDVDSMFDAKPRKTRIDSKEDFETFLSRFPSHRSKKAKGNDGGPADSQS